jgi:hypothetical protein
MKLYLIFVSISIAINSYAQRIVDPKLGSYKEDVVKYFDSLIAESNCSTCKIKYDIDSNGYLALKLDLPVSETGVKAVVIAAWFSYSKTQNKDMCIEFILYSSKENLPVYLDKFRTVLNQNDKGEWVRDTGILTNGKEILYKYKFTRGTDDFFRLDSYMDVFDIDAFVKPFLDSLHLDTPPSKK